MTKTQFRVLYREFLFRMVDLELLSTRGDMTKLLGQFAAMLAALSLMFAGGAVRIMNSEMPRSAILMSAWTEEHFLISTTMVVVGLFAVLCWDSTFPNQRDVLVLAPLPVQARTLLLAKVAAVATALSLTVIAVNVFTGISYPFALGSVNGGVLGVIRSLLAYWITMFAAGAFVLFSVLAAQGLAVQLARQRSLRLSAFLQLAAFCLILSVYFLQPALATPKALTAPENQQLLAWLPSYWFFGIFQTLHGSTHSALVPLVRRALVGLAVAGSAAAVTFLLTYFRTLRRIVEEPDIAPRSLRVTRSLRFGGSLHTAIVQFCTRTLLRSRQHRIVLAWYLGIGFAISLAYGRSLLYGLYGYSGHPWYEVNRPLLVATVVMMCFAVVGMRVVFSLPLTLQANWIFQTAVANDAPEYRAGVRRALLLLAAAPVWALSAVFLFAIWPLWPVAGHLLLLGLLGFILTDLCLVRFQKIPFTCSYLPGKAKIHVTSGACVLVLLALTDVGVHWELYALQHPVRYIPLAAILTVAAILLRWRAAEEAISPETSLQFEEVPPSPILTLDLRPDYALQQTNPSWSGLSPDDRTDPVTRGHRTRQRPASFRQWTIRIGAATFCLIAVLLVAGVTYQSVAGRLNLSEYPRPGRMIDVGGHRLHLHCTGQGSPTVVLESGGGGGMLAWRNVQPDVSQWTRVCSYDRSGYGWSESSTQPRTIHRVVEDLRVLLAEGRVEGPFVLVGHSLGGPYVQFFAARYPDEVAGMILVDATHEDTFENLPKYIHLFDWIVVVTQKLRVAGINRWFPQADDLTEKAFNNSNKQLSAMTHEEAGAEETLAELKATRISLGDRPLIVLTSGQNNQMEMWRRLQADLLTRSTNSKQIIAEGSGHAIHQDQPEVVIAAIREVVDATQRGRNHWVQSAGSHP